MRNIRGGLSALLLLVALLVAVSLSADRMTGWIWALAVVWILGLGALALDGLVGARRATRAIAVAGCRLGLAGLVAWALVRPDDLVSSRLPSAGSVRTMALTIAGALIVGVIAWLVRRRWRDTSRSRGAAGSMTTDFATARRNGYEVADVDALITRLDTFDATPDGRREAAEVIRRTRFHLARSGGYDPVEVDTYLYHRLAELESGAPGPQAGSAGSTQQQDA